MDTIGAEVGQKMRSAIKAKLMELDCYVDDELPDYIMVMVANRRTKSQMNEDLNLFLSTKTSTFVNWLHIVLKKLKEVTVTNPEAYKKATKRKNTDMPPDDKSGLKLKKEKSSKKVKKESQRNVEGTLEINQEDGFLTDNLPISVNKLAEKRKIILTDEKGQSVEEIAEDNFDIPLLSEVTESSNEQELQDIERKIRSVKSRLGILVESDNDEETINLKSEKDRLSNQVGDESKEANSANSQQISILEHEIIESEQREAEKPSSTTNILGKDRNIEVEKNKTSILNENRVRSKDHSDEDRENDMWVEKRPPQHKRITFEGDELERSSLRTKHDRLSERLRDRLRDTSQDKFRDKLQDRERSQEGINGKSQDRFRDRSPNRSPSKIVGKKPSILERLGKRLGSPESGRKQIVGSQYRKQENRFLRYSEEHRKRSPSRDRDRTNRVSSRIHRDERQSDCSRDRKSRSRDRSPYKSRERGREPRTEGIFGRVGVQSKISVIKKAEINHKIDEEEPKVIREVPSLIKVKPRVIPSDVPQPNKNLLLKAMADAQRSVAQTPKVGKEVKPDALYTKKYKEKKTDSTDKKESATSRLSVEKSRVKNIIQQSSNRMRSRSQQSSDEYDSDGEYIPKPVKNAERVVPSYIPSLKSSDNIDSSDTKENEKQQFIITLDGIDNLEQTVFAEKKTAVKLRLDSKKSPSPIIFDKSMKSIDTSTRPNIPDQLPVVHPPLSIKNKERCKYWPGCRQGDKCEFVHPSQNCELFPQCKFGDKCLFLHPKCKFGTSCTKRDCPYNHNKASISSKLSIPAPVQNCKFFPNCTNVQCPFYHPKPCKYGKYCQNIAECAFSHSFVVNKKSLSWRSNKR